VYGAVHAAHPRVLPPPIAAQLEIQALDLLLDDEMDRNLMRLVASVAREHMTSPFVMAPAVAMETPPPMRKRTKSYVIESAHCTQTRL
jgi:hypothetical protein